MLKFQVTIQNSITPHLQSIQQKLDALPSEAEKVFIQNTPIRSGNARRNTSLRNNNKTIVANYPYAQRLNEGYSKQSPQGMTTPTEEFIIKRYQDILAGK